VWRQWIVPGALTALFVAGFTVLVGRHLDDVRSSPDVGKVVEDESDRSSCSGEDSRICSQPVRTIRISR